MAQAARRRSRSRPPLPAAQPAPTATSPLRLHPRRQAPASRPPRAGPAARRAGAEQPEPADHAGRGRGEGPSRHGGAPQERTGSGQAGRAVPRRKARGPLKKQGGGKRSRSTKLRNADGSPTRSNPGFVDALPGPSSATGRAQLRHPQVPRADLPAADLPGRRHPVRRPLGGAGGDQRDRDRLRPQPQRVLRRRARLDAVHALHLADVRRRREQGRREGPVQPGRRDLRRRPLPQGRRLREGRPPRDLRLQPRRLVRGLGDAARPADRRRARPTSSARSPASPRAASPSTPAPATPTTSREQEADKRVKRGQNAANVVEGERRPPLDRDLRPPGRPGRGHQRRRGQEDRRRREARPLRRAPGRVRQPLHLRAASARSPSTTRCRRTDPDRQTSARALKAGTATRRIPSPAAPASAGSQPEDKRRSGRRPRRRPRAPRPRCRVKERLFAHPGTPGRARVRRPRAAARPKCRKQAASRPSTTTSPARSASTAKDVRLRRLQARARA